MFIYINQYVIKKIKYENLAVPPQAVESTAGQKVTFHAHKDEGGVDLHLSLYTYTYRYTT